MRQVKLPLVLVCSLFLSNCTTERLPHVQERHHSMTYSDLYNRPGVSVRKWVSPDIVDGMVTINGDWQNAHFHADQPSETVVTKLKGQIDAFDWVHPRLPQNGVFISTNFYGPTAIAQYSSTGDEKVTFSNDGNNLRLVVFEDGSYAFNNVIKSRKLVSVYLGNIVSGVSPSVLVESNSPDVEYRVEGGSRRFGKLFLYRRASDDKQSAILIYDVGSRVLERTHVLGLGEQLSTLTVSSEANRWCMVTVQHGTERLLSCLTFDGEAIGQKRLASGAALRMNISNNGQWLSILKRTTPAVVSTHRVDSTIEATHEFAFDPDRSVDRAVVNDRGDRIAFSGGSFSSPTSAGVVDLGSGVVRCLGCTLLEAKDAAVPKYSSYAVKPTHTDGIGDRSINVHVFEPATTAPKATIIYLHGGPQDHVSKTYSIGFFYQSMVRGYRIVAPNVRGSTDQDAAFEAADNGFARLNVLQDIKDVIADAIVRYGKPVFLLGDSFAGNYIFATAIGVGDISGIGCISCVYSRDSFLYDTPEAIIEVGDSRSDSVQRFWDNLEPLAIATKLKTPTIVVGGELDRRTPIQHMQKFVSIVLEHGGQIDAVSLPKGVHGVGDMATGELKQSSVADFFDRVLDSGTR